MFGFCRRSRSHEYHSLTDDWIVAGRLAVDGWPCVSIRSVSAVGPHVLVAKRPVPRKSLWYQFAYDGVVESLYAVTWKPKNAPPASMYRWKPWNCAADCGASSKNSTTFAWAGVMDVSR